MTDNEKLSEFLDELISEWGGEWLVFNRLPMLTEIKGIVIEAGANEFVDELVEILPPIEQQPQPDEELRKEIMAIISKEFNIFYDRLKSKGFVLKGEIVKCNRPIEQCKTEKCGHVIPHKKSSQCTAICQNLYHRKCIKSKGIEVKGEK